MTTLRLATHRLALTLSQRAGPHLAPLPPLRWTSCTTTLHPRHCSSSSSPPPRPSSRAPAPSSRRPFGPRLTLSLGLGLGLSGGTLLSAASLFSTVPPSTAPTDQTRRYTIHASASDAQPRGSSGAEVSGSSSVWREASPAAPRAQTVALVVLSSDRTSLRLTDAAHSLLHGTGPRGTWQPYIAYFREAGYNILDLNLAPSPSSSASSLEDDLHAQLRLASLQRLPVLLVRDGTEEAAAVSRYIQPAPSTQKGLARVWSWLASPSSARPAISGLVVFDAADKERWSGNPNLNVLLVGPKGDGNGGRVSQLDTSKKGDEAVVKDVERWLIANGYEG